MTYFVVYYPFVNLLWLFYVLQSTNVLLITIIYFVGVVMINMLNILSAINFQYFFNTDSGHFNWILVTSIIAIATFIWTIWFDNKKYRADLVLKTKIEWLQDMRNVYGKYIKATIAVFDGKGQKTYSSIADVKQYQLELLTYFGVTHSDSIFYSEKEENIIGIDSNIKATASNISALLVAQAKETEFLVEKIGQLSKYDKDKKIKQSIETSGNVSKKLQKKIIEGNKPSVNLEFNNKDFQKITLDGTLSGNKYTEQVESHLYILNRMVTEYLHDQWQKVQD